MFVGNHPNGSRQRRGLSEAERSAYQYSAPTADLSALHHPCLRSFAFIYPPHNDCTEHIENQVRQAQHRRIEQIP